MRNKCAAELTVLRKFQIAGTGQVTQEETLNLVDAVGIIDAKR